MLESCELQYFVDVFIYVSIFVTCRSWQESLWPISSPRAWNSWWNASGPCLRFKVQAFGNQKHQKPETISKIMWVKQCHKPAMTGNGKHSTYIYIILYNYIYIFMVMTGGWFMALFYPHYSQMTWNHTEFCPETWVHWDEVKQIRFRKCVHVFSFTMWNTSYHPEVMAPNFFGDVPKSPHAKRVIRVFHPAILRIWSWDVFQCQPSYHGFNQTIPNLLLMCCGV